jgi:RNA recognition motif-containing protein
LYVGNLDRRVTEYHLMQLFSQFGELTRVQFMWHHFGELKGQPRGFAFIEFANKEAACAAVEQANGVELAGRKMNVRFAQDKDPEEGGGGAGAGGLRVDYKSTAERRSAAVGARVSAYQSGGRGGGRGGFRGGHGDDYHRASKFAYVPAPLPSSGFRDVAASSGATTNVLRTALDKIRAIEDQLATEEEQLAFERREAARKQLGVDSITRPSAPALPASRATPPQQHQQQQPQQRYDDGGRDGHRSSGFVHPDRQKQRQRSRSRSPRAQRDSYGRR